MERFCLFEKKKFYKKIGSNFNIRNIMVYYIPYTWYKLLYGTYSLHGIYPIYGILYSLYMVYTYDHIQI